MAKALLKVPKSAKKGEVIALSAIFSHQMETGHRRDAEGQPLMSFTTVATASGPITFTWTDEKGQSWTETAEISVEE
jgi:sulfur-oxidizing protein SoxZ